MNSPNNQLDVSNLQNEITYGQNYRNLILLQQKPIYKTRDNDSKITNTKRKKQWSFRRVFKCSMMRNRKLSLLERNALTQDEYMRILSIPRTVHKKKIEKKIKRKKLKIYPTCPPHIKELALPKKRLVLETWKQYQDLLEPEVLLRFNEILHNESHRLEISEASYYFKQLNRKKRRKRRHMKRPIVSKWLRDQICKLASIICNFIRNEDSYDMDMKQSLISDEILNFLVEKGVIKKKPERDTKNYCLRMISEICGKLSLWFDEFAESAELKPSLLEDLVVITSKLSLIEEVEGEEEGESEEEGEGEEEEEEEEEEEGGEEIEDEDLDNLFIREFDESESESELEFDYEQEGFDFITGLDEDSLEKLIRILKNSSDEYLDSYLDPTIWPTVKNRDVLNKLIEFRDGLLDVKKNRTNRLEELMTMWAKRNQPDQVDDRVMNKIQLTSRVIAELLGLGEKEDKDVQLSRSTSEDDEEARRRRKELEDLQKGKRKGDLDFYPDEEVEASDDYLSVIRAHKPPVTYPHSPDKICCLSLKIWSIWLMQITQNLHKWTIWLISIIKKIRNYSMIVRDPEKKLYKQEWREFCKETEERIITWREYSHHVQKLSDEIIENFSGKGVICCPACLYNHKIPNVVQAHETIQALVEAINCAAYWHRCLDKIVEQANAISDIDLEGSQSSESTESTTTSSIEIIETTIQRSEESVYEIEEITTHK